MATHSLFAELHSIEKFDAEALIFSVYHKNMASAIKIWLAMSFSISDMPIHMLFASVDLKILPNDIIRTTYDDCKRPAMVFNPEFLGDKRMTGNYTGVMGNMVGEQAMEPVHLDALKAMRKIPLYKSYDYDRYRQHQSFMAYKTRYGEYDINWISHQLEFRAFGAICEKNLSLLKSISTDPTFIYSERLFNIAASRPDLPCFNFLALNGCSYLQSTFESACAGGDEEIIQRCLEHGGQPTDKALQQAVIYMQNKVAVWLVEVHGVEPTTDTYNLAFECSNWIMLTYFHARNFVSAIPIDKYGFRLTKVQSKTATKHYIRMLLEYPDLPEKMRKSLAEDTFQLIRLDDLELLDLAGCKVEHFGIIEIPEAGKYRSHNILTKLKELNRLDQCESDYRETFTPITFALNESMYEAVETLLEYGSDPNYVDADGLTALFHLTGYRDGLPFTFLRYGANPNVGKFQARSLLIEVVRNGNVPLTKALIEHGANIEATCKGTKTALIHAVQKSNTWQCIIPLVEGGANVNARDRTGKTALAYCKQKTKLAEAFTFLQSHGATE